MNLRENIDIDQALLVFLKTTLIDKDVKISSQTPFSELGIDSLSIIDLVLFLERRFQVIIPEDELIPKNLNSVAALASCAGKHLPA